RALEREPPSARAAHLLEEALADEGLERLFEVLFRGAGERREVAHVERLAGESREREEVAQVARKPLEAALDRLLDRGGESARGEEGASGGRREARLAHDDLARFLQGAGELPREVRVPLRRLAAAPRERGVGAGGAAAAP